MDIIVTDVNELPVVTDEDVDESPMTAIMYPEIDDGAPNTAVVATYVGTDPEGSSISWDLRGADAALFTIAGGVLQFVNSPDFENPKDVAGENTATPTADAKENTYSIVARAIASRTPAIPDQLKRVDTTVTVTVTERGRGRGSGHFMAAARGWDHDKGQPDRPGRLLRTLTTCQ